MIVFCEECGKKYKIDSSKLKGDSAYFACTQCNHRITVVKKSDDEVQEIAEQKNNDVNNDVQSGLSAAESDFTMPEQESDDTDMTTGHGKPGKGLGLRGKMILLFCMIPITIIAVSGVFNIWQMDLLGSRIADESIKVVRKLAEDMITVQGRAVAEQCKLYFKNHPGLEKQKEYFNTMPEFRDVAMQKIGKTGYTVLYEKPGPDGIWRVWTHPTKKIIGIDMHDLKKSFGRNFSGFWKVFTGVGNRNESIESRGYYKWIEKDGTVREKYMICTPVRGTSFVIAATTYIDEFTKPVQVVREHADTIINNTKYIFIGIVAATILIISIVVIMYGNHLRRRISRLTEITNRISMGELDAKLVIDSNDELGVLAQAIERMQESIRLSIERLRRRRSSR